MKIITNLKIWANILFFLFKVTSIDDNEDLEFTHEAFRVGGRVEAGWVKEWRDGTMEERKDGRMEIWKYGRIEGWKDGRVEGNSNLAADPELW